MRKSNNTALNYIAGFLNTGLPGNVVKKSVTMTASGPGKQGAYTLFTVTGVVAGVVIGVCRTDLVGANATIEVGITGSTALLVAQTLATDIDIGEMWRNNTPIKYLALNSTNFPLTAISGDIIQTVATADISAGVIDYYFIYTPITDTGLVV